MACGDAIRHRNLQWQMVKLGATLNHHANQHAALAAVFVVDGRAGLPHPLVSAGKWYRGVSGQGESGQNTVEVLETRRSEAA